jgi:hypothetical protein
VSRALALAKRTRRRVAVTALTTPTSTTSANPSGTLTTSETLQPVRAWQDGAWTALNATLYRGRNGTVSPAVTSNGLALSGGGTSPLATLTADARTLTLSWPGRLPAPTLSGPTATYANVLPGVDLVVTADDQGGFSDTLVVHTAAAAANPALHRLSLRVSSSGLTLSANPAGDLSVTIRPGDAPVITTQTPQIWDSTPPPTGTRTLTEPGGQVVNAANGLPAYSSVTAPGSAAHVATVPVTLSGGTLTLTPPAAALTGAGIDYPVYIDPTWHDYASSQASAWTQVDSGFPNQSYWGESSDLQSGDCYDSPAGSCAGLGVARSFFRMPIPSQLYSTTDVDSAYLYMTEDWAASCTKTSVRLYTTTGISSSTTWAHQPTWASGYSYQDASFGHPGCNPPSGYYKNDITWDVTQTIASVEGHQTTQTFGLRAANESDTTEWKKFWSSSKNLTLSVTYNYRPNAPTNPTTSPGGSCQTSSSDPAQIGDDDVTFSAYVSDNDGDDNLTTRFVISNASDGSTAYDSAQAKTNVATGDKTDAELSLPAATIQNFNKGGNTRPFTYYWQADTTNDVNLTSGWSSKCWFTYNPTGPQEPIVTSSNTSFTLGQPATFLFTAPSGCGPTTSPCPVKYVYQLGNDAPQTVPADSTSHNWNGPITIDHEGPLVLSVYGLSAAANPSETAYFSFTSGAPVSSYADGYFTGGSYPDLLTVGPGSGSVPSLWLHTGSGSGTLNSPEDIGTLGTEINVNTQNDGPDDWTGADVLHGQFTGNGVQDVMAYYPAGTANQGLGVIIGGTGDDSTLVPSAGNTYVVEPDELTDPNLCGSGACPAPTDLVAASDASNTQPATGLDDLIGILGNSGDPSSYELALFGNGGFPGQFSFITPLSTASPGGDSWQNYTLATAQPGCYPVSTGICNEGNVVLFALDTSTGQLWDTTTSSGVIGSWNSIIPVPWGSQPPALLSADTNAAGQTELWTGINNPLAPTLTAYTVSGSTITQENASGVSIPADEWPLNDGNSLAQPGASSAADVTGGYAAALTGSAAWGTDGSFSTDIELNGQPGYLQPPSTSIAAGGLTFGISIWFKTTTPGGALVSMQQNPLSSGPALPSEYDPVLYVGTDGLLYGEWWYGKASPAVSKAPVDDGLWHHAELSATPAGQTLTLDGTTQDTVTGTPGFQFSPANLAFGAGYIGGGWPSEPNYKKTDSSDYRWYFTGQIADITYSYNNGP